MCEPCRCAGETQGVLWLTATLNPILDTQSLVAQTKATSDISDRQLPSRCPSKFLAHAIISKGKQLFLGEVLLSKSNQKAL